LLKHHAIRIYGRVLVKLHTFLTSALDESEWAATSYGNFTPRERSLNTHWIEDLLKSRSGVDKMAKRKIPASAENQTLVSQ
jgi:hypothetical protein